MITKKEDYNNVPVYYCTRCISLNIINMDENTCYCGDCGAASIDSTHIDEWLKLKENITNN